MYTEQGRQISFRSIVFSETLGQGINLLFFKRNESFCFYFFTGKHFFKRIFQMRDYKRHLNVPPIKQMYVKWKIIDFFKPLNVENRFKYVCITTHTV